MIEALSSRDEKPLVINDKAPIFVLGCPRSGTSLLRRLLNAHSNIACPPESAFIVQLARIYEIKRAAQGLGHMGFSESEILEQMRVFAAHFFEEYARRKGKRRWADKSASYLNHVDTIDLMFRKQAVYVGIMRHGLDVAYSMCDFDMGILRPYLVDGVAKPIAGIRLWRDMTMKLLDFAEKTGGRFHLVRYETLTAEPEPVLMSLFEFLGEAWEERILNYNDFEHDVGFEDPKVAIYKKIVRNSGNYKNWSPELQAKVYQEARVMLERLNYAI